MVSDVFDVQVYDKDLARAGWLGGIRQITATPRHGQQPTASLMLDADHRLAADLNAKGARVVLRYRDEHLMSGPVRLVAAEGGGPEQTLTYQVQDDWRLLRRLLAWQVPGAAVTGQSSAYGFYSGPAETVVKSIVSDNVARLGSTMRPTVTVAPDQGRGGQVDVQVRMHPLADRIFPVIEHAGIGVSVRQVGAGLVVDCYEPQVWPITLSEAAGTLSEAGWSRSAPEVTRVVVGGPGEGQSRVYRAFADAAREAEWGDVIEAHVDARDIGADDPNFEALMAARGAEALAAGAEKSGLSLTLSETKTFRYGGVGGLHVGDRAPVELATGITITDVVREATIAASADQGVAVTPQVGERADGDQAVVRAVSALAQTVRDLRAGR